MSRIHQATGLTRALGRVSDDSAPTDPAKSPEQLDGEAPAHHELARLAVEAGFPDASPSLIHLFAKARLIPPTTTRRSLGAGGFATELRLEVLPQLLALFSHRRSTRSRNQLAILLWADGWEVPIDLVKHALLTAVPRLPRLRSDRALDALDRAAVQMVGKLVRHFRPGRMGKAGMQAAATLLPVVFAAIDRIDDAAARTLERLAGLHRGRTDVLPGVEPWLKARPSFAWNTMLCYAPPSRMREYIASASPQLLNDARRHARFVIHEFPRFARAVEARKGRGFGGWRFIARLDGRHAAMLAALAILIDGSPAAARRLQQLIDGLGSSRGGRELLLELEAQYLVQHPSQTRELHRLGLEGLIEHGLNRPLDGIDDLLARAEVLEGVGVS